MNIAEILSCDQILPRVSASDRWVLIDLLVDMLVRTGKIRGDDRAAVSKAIKDRETPNSTGIGFGVALPHASVSCISEVVAVLARVQPGVDFQALDNQPVTICLLFLTPSGQFQQHLHTLSAFARFFSDKSHRQQLDAATSAEQIHAILRAVA